MTYSVLTKVTNDFYNSQKFYMYKHTENTLTILNEKEAEKLKDILNSYPNVFSEVEIVPRSEEEIKLLDITRIKDDEILDFDFENVSDDCNGILDKLTKSFNSRISGIDRNETYRQTYED